MTPNIEMAKKLADKTRAKDAPLRICGSPAVARTYGVYIDGRVELFFNHVRKQWIVQHIQNKKRLEFAECSKPATLHKAITVMLAG